MAVGRRSRLKRQRSPDQSIKRRMTRCTSGMDTLMPRIGTRYLGTYVQKYQILTKARALNFPRMFQFTTWSSDPLHPTYMADHKLSTLNASLCIHSSPHGPRFRLQSLVSCCTWSYRLIDESYLSESVFIQSNEATSIYRLS